MSDASADLILTGGEPLNEPAAPSVSGETLAATPEDKLRNPSEANRKRFGSRISAAVAARFARVRDGLPGARARAVEALSPGAGAEAVVEAQAKSPDDAAAALRAEARPRPALPWGKFSSWLLWRQPETIGVAGAVVVGIAVLGGFLLWPGTPDRSPETAQETGVGPVSDLTAPASKLAGVPLTEMASRPVIEIPPIVPKEKMVEEVASMMQGGVQAKAGEVAKAAELAKTGEVAKVVEVARDGNSRLDTSSKIDTSAKTAPVTNANANANAQLNVAPARVNEVGLTPPEPVANSIAIEAKGKEVPPAQAVTASLAVQPSTDAETAAHEEEVANSKLDEAMRKVREATLRVEKSKSSAAPDPATVRSREDLRVAGMLTEMAAVARRALDETAQLREERKKADTVIDARLADFERRLNMAEARRALDAAKAGPSTPPEPVAPAPVSLPAKPAVVSQKGVAKASFSTLSAPESAAASPAARYRVQAASPGLAMLAEIDRSGEEIAPLQVAIGVEVPGYGRVTKISQHGTEWVVQTEKGSIY